MNKLDLLIDYCTQYDLLFEEKETFEETMETVQCNTPDDLIFITDILNASTEEDLENLFELLHHA